jgi:hypothetical protein
MIHYKREADGVDESSWVSGATRQGMNRYSIDSVVPDMPGDPVDQDLTIQMVEYEQHVVEIPDINTPPEVFYLPVRASNKLDFAWNPGLPVIEIFHLNWDEGETTVSPGQTIHLGWNVTHVSRIQVRRISATGPALDVTHDFPTMQNSVVDYTTTGPFNGLQPATARYQITAENQFGSVSSVGEVNLRQDPDITILGVEVTQAIQRFSLDDPVDIGFGITIPSSAWNNSVDLVHQKRTMARVYVDSGLTNNFSNGAGPNRQPNVTGEIKVYQGGGQEPSFTVAPRNPAGAITARPSGDIDRDEMEHTLNFEIPWDLLPSGAVELEVTVWVESDVDGNNHQNDSRYVSRYKDVHDSTVFALHLQGGVAMVRVLIADNNLGNAAPSVTDYFGTVEGAETRYPVGINGFSFFIAPGNTQINTNRNLTTTAGWEDLLMDLVDIAGGYQNNGEIWTGLVPNDVSYDLNGIAWDRYCISRTGLLDTFAHELTHCHGVGHADCGNPTGLDDRLPDRIEETGVDVYDYEIHEEGVGELMSYCDRPRRWPSVALWNILMDEI